MSLRLLAFALALTGIASAAEAADRTYTVTDFTKLRVDGGYHVKLVTGVAPFAKASGSPAALDAVSVEVLGQTLIVRRNQSAWGGYPGERPGPVELTIGTHDLGAVWLNGAGSVDIDKVRGLSFQLALQGAGSASVGKVAVDKLQADVVGSGSIRLGGDAANFRTSVRGPGLIDASALSAHDASIEAEGDAVVKVTATNTADVRSTGTATVELGGKPACTVKASGSSTVSGCR